MLPVDDVVANLAAHRGRLTIGEVSRIMGAPNPEAINRWRRMGLLRAIKTTSGRAQYVFEPDDIVDFVRRYHENEEVAGMRPAGYEVDEASLAQVKRMLRRWQGSTVTNEYLARNERPLPQWQIEQIRDGRRK